MIISLFTSTMPGGGDTGGFLSLFTQLGALGGIAGVLWMWKASETKDKDRLHTAIEQQTPLLSDIRSGVHSSVMALQESTRALEASTAAISRMTEAISRLPSEAETVRLRDALNRRDPPRGS